MMDNIARFDNIALCYRRLVMGVAWMTGAWMTGAWMTGAWMTVASIISPRFPGPGHVAITIRRKSVSTFCVVSYLMILVVFIMTALKGIFRVYEETKCESIIFIFFVGKFIWTNA